jgi:ABC-type lipoprotein export system ATPase subunit
MLTALGLGLGVGLVVTVGALSAGLDRAQAKILDPLTGVGTDMSVTRPIDLTPSAGGAFPQLSDRERRQLERENGGGRLALTNLGEPGDRFSRDTFVSATQLSFSASNVRRIRSLEGVSEAAGGLTLNALHIEGTVPKTDADGGVFRGSGQGGVGGPPASINGSSRTVAGVDETHRALGAITPGQVTKGRYFRSGAAREAILNESYASREGLRFVFQQFNLIPTLTAAQNVEVALAPTGGTTSTRRARAAELLARVGLAHRADHLPSRMSGGEQQRVAIARALANGPHVILADEPTGNLDSETGAEIVDVLRSLANAGTTVVLVTHDGDVAARAGRVVLMRDGRVTSVDGLERAPHAFASS